MEEHKGVDFLGLHAENKGSFFVPFPVRRVFPLYGPVEEAKRAPGWEPQWLYPSRASAQASVPERGWVFITGENSEKKKLWYLQKADFFQHEISYTVYWPDLMVYRIDVGAASSVEPVSK